MFFSHKMLLVTAVLSGFLFVAGFVGLFSALFLWPGFFILHYSHHEPFQWPNSRQWMFIAVNGIVGTVLSEFLWLW